MFSRSSSSNLVQGAGDSFHRWRGDACQLPLKVAASRPVAAGKKFSVSSPPAAQVLDTSCCLSLPFFLGRWRKQFCRKISGRKPVVLARSPRVDFVLNQHGFRCFNQLHDQSPWLMA